MPFSESELECEQHLHLWQKTLEKLAEKKLGWEQFWRDLGASPLSHPVTQLTTPYTGRTLLHLAVLQDQHQMVQELANSISLKRRRDSFGMTPLDMAQFLRKNESVQ